MTVMKECYWEETIEEAELQYNLLFSPCFHVILEVDHRIALGMSPIRC